MHNELGYDEGFGNPALLTGQPGLTPYLQAS